MILFLILVITEVLTFVVIRQHFRDSSRVQFYILSSFNAVLSLYMWMIYYRVSSFRGSFDDPVHIWLMMTLAGAFSAILLPRVILNICHFSGVLFRIRKGGHIRRLTNAGFIISIFIFIIILSGSTIGKLNFKTEEVKIKVSGLNPSLEGLTIVQLSDLHLAGFHKHKQELKKVIEMINTFKPDLLINSGDFISFGWKEFERDDTILSIAKAKYGNFAVDGNHDIGTYDPDWSSSDRDSNLLRINDLIRASGYQVLSDENTTIQIGQARLSIIGVITRGRHPHMTHGDLNKAMKGTDSSDFRILISHDPNHWEEAVKGKTNIELTLSGHTHGMQMGIMTKYFKWSPSKYFYPRWNGLYSSGNQFLYVNRGLGVLAIPFRIWMPPEITVIHLISK